MLKEDIFGHTPSVEEKAILFERIAKFAGKFSQDLYDRTWMPEEKKFRHEHFNIQLRIVSAANRYKDLIIMGVRHHDEMMRIHMAAFGGFAVLFEYAGGVDEQGFVDQYLQYHNREEAWIIAEAAGQIIHPDVTGKGTLYSEHLY